MEQTHYWYWLNNIEGIGRKTQWRLIEYFGDPKRIYEATEEEVGAILKRKEISMALMRSKNEEVIVSKYEDMKKMGIEFIYPDLMNYPSIYRMIPDPPTGLYLKGRLPQQEQRCVAIIGARMCSRYGLEMARFFGRELAKVGVAIVSGLASGVDGMAHRGALEANGYTLGIIAGGIDRIYPKENYELYMQLEKKGGILSESNIGIRPVSGLFPQRNRLISGLCDGILVVEAKEKSGTFITVDQGLEQGKEIFAIPGRISDEQSIGCNHLIKLGAHIVTEVSDILDLLKINHKKNINNRCLDVIDGNVSKLSLAPLEKMVYSCLRIDPRYIDDIIVELQIAPQDICRVLNQMVLTGLIEENPRNYYAIKI